METTADGTVRAPSGIKVVTNFPASCVIEIVFGTMIETLLTKGLVV
jgi:hypothetical protein